MNYDISTIEDCYATLRDLTGFEKWNDLYDIYKYQYIDCPDETQDEIIDRYNIRINVTSENFFFVLQHITTSANGCEDIKNNGIYDLEWVLENDTELRRFLVDNLIEFEISSNKMYIDNIAYDISNDSNGVGFKIFKDKDICGCFQINKNCPYGGNVHTRPEILHNINKYLIKTNLSYNWYVTHKPYIVKFKVPYDNMDLALGISVKNDSEDVVFNKLLSYAINFFFYRDLDSDKIGILKRNIVVPSKDIISITEY